MESATKTENKGNDKRKIDQENTVEPEEKNC